MKKIIVGKNKTLKLNNVLGINIKLEDLSQTDVFIEKMINVIKVNGAEQLGPLIQHSYVSNDEDNPIRIELLVQCDRFLNKIEEPFIMRPIIRVSNCMYCRYIGLEENQGIGYDKKKLEPYENDIDLTGNTNTIYDDSKENEGTTVTVELKGGRA